MAYTTVSALSSFPQPRWFTYTGDLISSLLDIVENAEQVHAEDVTELEREPRPLTIDDVLEGSARRSTAKTQTRAWYELQSELAAKASRRSQ
jgi:hypothetical protein